jgi:hypothetical protein
VGQFEFESETRRFWKNSQRLITAKKIAATAQNSFAGVDAGTK